MWKKNAGRLQSWEKIGGAQTLSKTKNSTKIWMSK